MSRWYVYLIECRDGSLYTGIATDVERRYAEHAAGKGARYTRSRPPVRLLARFEHPDRAAASRAEHAIKQLTPARKRALCAGAAAPGASASRCSRLVRQHQDLAVAFARGRRGHRLLDPIDAVGRLHPRRQPACGDQCDQFAEQRGTRPWRGAS